MFQNRDVSFGKRRGSNNQKKKKKGDPNYNKNPLSSLCMVEEYDIPLFFLGTINLIFETTLIPRRRFRSSVTFIFT